MTISMHQALVPPVTRMLGSLAAILGKAAAHCEARKIDPAVLVSARLYPDMFPLSRQVQIATDIAKGGAARLAGVEPPSWEDKEATIPELVERLERTIAYLRTFGAAQIDGSEDREIRLKLRQYERQFTGLDYLLQFVLPNVYFHVTTAYNILRHNGVEIGKQDYLGRD